MFTTQQVIGALLVGLAVGVVAGMVVWEVLVTDAWRRRTMSSRRRADTLAMRAYSEDARRRAFEGMRDAIARTHPELVDDHLGSRKAPSLRAVQ